MLHRFTADISDTKICEVFRGVPSMMTTNPTSLRCLPRAPGRVAALFLALALASAAPARAQISVLTGNPLLYADWVQGSANAWDPAHAVYLVVGASSNTTTAITGIFTDVNGNAISGRFALNGGGVYSHFPSVAYSPNLPNGSGGVGAFLVTWHENGVMSNGVEVAQTTNTVQSRVVSYPAGPIGAQQSLVGPVASFWLSPASVKYSSISNIFFVAWRGMDTMLYGARLDGNGTLITAPFRIVPSSQSYQNPTLAFDSVTNQFGVLSTGYGGPSGATTAITIVTAAGSVVGTNIFNAAAQTFVTAIDFNPATGHYIGVWYQSPGGTMGAEIASTGTVIAQGLVSTATGTPDTEGISYNPVTGTFLLAAQGQTFNDWGAELNAHGVRDSGDMEITSTGGPKGSFYPSPSPGGGARWNVSFSHNFTELHDQIIATSTTGGGPAGSLGAAPGGQTGGSTPPAPTGGCLGSAPFPGAVCVGNGWVPGSGGSSGGGGSTGGCAGSAPFPGAVCSNGGWVAGSGGSSGGSTSTGNCAGSAPFPGAVCVGNGWVPGSGGSSGGGSPTPTTPTTGCPGSAPFAGAVCQNGGWVPGATGSTSCPGYPTAPFPGATCVNGGWVAGSGGGTTPPPAPTTPTSSCPGSAPFAGAVCVNGGWVPGSTGSTSCPGYPNPAFPGAVCVNGGWVPGSGATTTTTGSCLGSAPFPGAVCVGNGWVPGPTISCTTPDPFTAIGGGVCNNGGWTPKG
jgi:hypothetical protein